MNKIRGNELEKWKLNAEEDYIKTPISVLKYITVLEELNEQLNKPVVNGRSEERTSEQCCEPIPVDGFNLGTCCPKCNQPFRVVKGE